MNGIEKIIDRIAADTKQEIAVINNETAAKCSQITESYKEAAEKEFNCIVAEGKAAADARYERLYSAAQLDAKKQILKEKQDIVSQTFDHAVKILRALPDDKYSALLAKLAFDASRNGKEQIILSADDRAKYGETVCQMANNLLASRGKEASLSLSESTRDICGGLILVDGKIEINCSLEILVAEHKDSLTAEVAKILFD